VKMIRTISLLVLVAASFLGLGLLFLNAQGSVLLSNVSFSVVAVAVISLLVLLGFFLGSLLIRKEPSIQEHKRTIKHLRTALEIERRQHIGASKECYTLRENIIELESRIKKGSNDEDSSRQNSSPESTANEQTQKKIKELVTLCERLKSELTSRKERMVDLQTELYIAQTQTPETQVISELIQTKPAPPITSSITKNISGNTLNEVLVNLVSMPGIIVALVADDQGLIVDKAGKSLDIDALAAVSGLVAELSPKISDLLPIGKITTVALGDIDNKFMEVRYFQLLESRCALTIIREDATPHSKITQTAIEVIQAKLDH